MTNIYTVKPNDTLLGIAIKNNISLVELLEINPQYQPNPDLININDSITLPNQEKPSLIELKPVEPVNMNRPTEGGCAIARPTCKGIEVCDVVFKTGNKTTDYFLLDKHAQELLEEEISYTQQLIDGYEQILQKAPENNANQDSAAVAEHKAMRQKWYDMAISSGALPVKTQTEAQPTSEDDPFVNTIGIKRSDINKNTAQAKINELEERKKIIKTVITFEPTEITLVDALISEINTELKRQEYYIKAVASTDESSVKQGINPKNFTSKDVALTNKKQGIIEIFIVSQNKLVYIRQDFMAREKPFWRHSENHTHLNQAVSSGNWKEMGKAISSDITNGMTDGIKNTIDGQFEGKIIGWQVPGYKLKEWKANKEFKDANGETVYAVNAEAQLLRFAAQASVKGDFNLKQAKFDLGFAAESSASLAEGAVTFNSYFPHEKGYSALITYTDANGKSALYPLGHFRCSATLTLSCLVTAMVNGKAMLTNTAEKSAGTGVIFSPHPTMAVKPSGQIGVSAEGFAGAQAGGQLKGSVEWLTPQKTGTTDFSALVEIKAEGNVAFGLGAGVDFQLRFDPESGKFECHCCARLVWGPGASGGFGTSIDFSQLFELTKIIWEAIDTIGCRVIKNIDSHSYNYLYQAAYSAFTNINLKTIEENIKAGTISIRQWWEDRLLMISDEIFISDEAKRLTERILDRERKVLSGVSLKVLPPETVGMMLNTLVHTYWLNFEESQEKAIYLLLGGAVRSWRKFVEVLAHMNEIGEKQNSDIALITNLQRINNILDFSQQREFNQWIAQLASLNYLENMGMVPKTPFTISSPQRKFKRNNL
ncbi:LysM peptidoglycan-binding domain-containing protein [Photobacterium iliopiscarium]|uniref:LysM peptidoglycan-binding domain-containing protein n=1 Tax=Photobacterium iliopiscarium TaxID=56192 RepID=UPI000D16DA62|nr:LysM domain-containing protein [Photobacterium iliopiscarium]PST99694.1 hypothetical protein C9I85_10810 [Photobacterium iliopiscarium]PSV83018.1 hypothetical protein C9J51_10835 [Photobacterium iliopiscarium]